MRFIVAEAGFVVLLLSWSVVLGQSDYGVTYTSTQICAVEGSTVEISCSYTYPSRINEKVTVVEEAVWLTKMEGGEPVDLMTDAEFSGRVQYHCDENRCTLRISDLRERDSAEYKFRFTTNQPGGKYTGSPGVTLTVSVLHVEAKISSPTLYPTWAQVKCQSRCRLSDPSYVWYQNGLNMNKDTYSIKQYFDDGDSVSCAVKGFEKFPSPPQCVLNPTCNKVTYTDRSICAPKGSSVDISSTYSHYDYYDNIVSRFWFSRDRSRQWKVPSQPEDLRKDSQYSGRVQVLEPWTGRSTLRITNLRETDSSEYHFKFKTQWFEWRSVLPGTTLTVTALQVQVTRIISVHQSHTEAELKCLSSCRPAGRLYVWFKNGQKIRTQQTSTLTDNFSPGDTVSCAFSGHEDYRSPSVYAPKLPSVTVNPSEESMEGSSVTLTCSSDANPAAKYTWYKENQILSEGTRFVFRSTQSSDSGEYYCTAQNELGTTRSERVTIDVKYPPKLPSVSVSPSTKIEEGSSVTLTCSSDANPAANYTWYKENQTLINGSEGVYHFTSISSEDRGIYYCKSENQYGQITSTPLLLDVEYPPKLPSVSVNVSGEIVEGSSVTLTCSSDANPAANYTWYKENEDSPKASGQIFTITDFKAEHSGSYYCEAQNRRGRHNSTLHLIGEAGAQKTGAIATVSVVLLVVIVLAVFLWMRRNTCFKQQCKGEERPVNTTQSDMGPVYDTPSSAAVMRPTDQQDDVLYSSICFPQSQTDVLYSNIRRAQRTSQTEEEEDDGGTEYAAVQCVSSGIPPGKRRQDKEDDSFALYSTVNKNYTDTT